MGDMVPKVGNVVYFAAEHLYYPKKPDGSYGLVEKEYTVIEGIIDKILFFDKFKRRTEAQILFGKYAGNVSYHRLSEFGKTIFFDVESAVKMAEKMTEEYENRWHEKLRHPWINSTADGKPYFFEPFGFEYYEKRKTEKQKGKSYDRLYKKT